MSVQVNYVCWTSQDVTATIPTEAATPSDAVLLATHAPLRIRRQASAIGDESSKVIRESDVLDEFLTRETNNGVLVAPVLGESGAGKSHLIRWVNAKIPAQAGRHVIYLQKTQTSLKDVIEALLVDQHDPGLDEIRRRVSGLGAGITADEMEHKILAELAEALRTAKADNPYGKALVGENGLRLFFTDPLFEHHLLRPGSFIKRRAKHALHGRDADEPDVPLEFTADELPLDIVDNENIRDAAAATQRLFSRLVASTAMQTEAVRLLNEHLDVAVTKAASLNVGDIGQAFQKIREMLVGQEIVLLIEDVALIQGVRRDLLDAIIEVGVVQGAEKFASVRTLMAVTPSYYREQLPETFRRRAEASSPIYQVDVDLSLEREDAEQEELLVDFVGRYLNAARVGKKALESAAPSVPNGCHSCRYRGACHATFGTSGSGDAEYGLYPYNRPAILRAIRACATRDGDRVNFNPRQVLSRAIRDTLNSNIDVIESGNFPPTDFLAEESSAMGLPRLPTHIREMIENNYSPEEAGRVESLLTFWGGSGTVKVNEDIVVAFDHPSLPDFSLETPDVVLPPIDREGASEGIPRSLQKQLDDIDRWSQGQVFPQALAVDIRKIVREALLSRIEWFDIVIKEPDTATLTKAIPENARGVSIEGANENLAAAVPPLLRIERSARNATTLKGLALIKGGHPERAGDALARLDALVAGSLGEAKQRILAALAIDDDSLVGAAASLIKGAAACGALPARPKESDYVNACLWREGSDRPDIAARTPEWVTAYRDYLAVRGKAVDLLMAGIGAAQGAGGVYAIDILRLLPIVRRAKDLAEAGDDFEVTAWCAEAHRRLKALLRTNGRQITHWKDLLRRIRYHLPESVTFTETVDAVLEAVKNGQDLGLVPVSNLQDLEALNAEARNWDSKCVREVERLVSSAEGTTGIAALSMLGSVVGSDLPRIADYLESTSRWVESGIRAAEIDGGATADVDSQLAATINAWFELLKEPNS